MNTQKFKDNGNFKFPVSTDTFDFMQKQILLASELSALAGGNVIIKPSTNSEDGICIYNGELMPLKKQADTHIILVNNIESITANGENFPDVRSVRYAEYTNAGGVPATNFWTLSNLQTLKSQLDAAAQHYVPTGAIMMWSGAIANIPAGWALCNGQNGTPDLQGRFIVGASTGNVTFDNKSYSYPVGTTGGKNEVKLTLNQLPSHNHGGVTGGESQHHSHGFSNQIRNNSKRGTTGSEELYSTFEAGSDLTILNNTTDHTHSIPAAGGNQAHENRPVFYALAYIMKII